MNGNGFLVIVIDEDVKSPKYNEKSGVPTLLSSKKSNSSLRQVIDVDEERESSPLLKRIKTNNENASQPLNTLTKLLEQPKPKLGTRPKKSCHNIAVKKQEENFVHMPVVKEPPKKTAKSDSEEEHVNIDDDDESPCEPGNTIKIDNDRTYYDSIKYRGDEYKVGECALFDGGVDPWIGFILSLYKEENEYNVECYWYFSPLHTHTDRKPVNDHKFEIFLSRSKDTNSINTLLGTNVKVLTENEWETRKRKGKNMENVYFCRKFWNHATKVLEPLPTSPILNFYGHHHLKNQNPLGKLIHMEYIMSQIDQLSIDHPVGEPKNWPQGIEYLRFNKWDPKISLDTRKKLESSTYFNEVTIKKITDSKHRCYKQYGLFAHRDFKEGTAIGNYTGLITPGSSSSSQLYSFEFFKEKSQQLILDAEQSGNEFRFINDYRGIANEPNVHFWAGRHEMGSHQIIVVTDRDIKKGEELVANYGDNYWEENVD